MTGISWRGLMFPASRRRERIPAIDQGHGAPRPVRPSGRPISRPRLRWALAGRRHSVILVRRGDQPRRPRGNGCGTGILTHAAARPRTPRSSPADGQDLRVRRRATRRRRPGSSQTPASASSSRRATPSIDGRPARSSSARCRSSPPLSSSTSRARSTPTPTDRAPSCVSVDRLMPIADRVRHLRVRANADAEDAARARLLRRGGHRPVSDGAHVPRRRRALVERLILAEAERGGPRRPTGVAPVAAGRFHQDLRGWMVSP